MRSPFILILSLFVCFSASAQRDGSASTTDADTLAPYQKNPTIPAFNILLSDSTWFSKQKLQPKKPTLILYFNPDCGHCQLETEEVLSKMKELNKLQIVMITSRPYEDMHNFADHYKISRFPAIKIGSDPSRMVTRFYAVKFTPFSALYDRKGKLVKVYDKGIDMPELVSMLDKNVL